MSNPHRSVFLCYRRGVSWAMARLVFRDLDEHGFDVFMDVESIDSGEFERMILTQVQARAHFLVLLEPSLDRIAEPGDWLRREIAHALTHERNVVPLLADGFRMPQAGDLPPDVARLASFNAVSVPHDYFDEAMAKLRARFLRATELPQVTPPPTDTSGVRRRTDRRAERHRIERAQAGSGGSLAYRHPY